jgi:hypothetical protein
MMNKHAITIRYWCFQVQPGSGVTEMWGTDKPSYSITVSARASIVAGTSAVADPPVVEHAGALY